MAQADINSVTLVGRLTRDAEVREAGDLKIANLRLAFTSREKRGGEWQDRSNFMDVTIFGREGLHQYLLKGTRIGVQGRISWREWQDGQGNKRQNVEIVANDVQLLDSKGEGQPKAASNDDSIPF